MKTLVFDMDGTLADTYNVNGWLKMLRAEDPTPYIKAKPLYDMVLLTAILWVLKNDGWRIAVTSWLAKESSPEYDAEVKQAKIDWLRRYDFPYDEIHLVKYGTTKANCTRKLGGFQILIDDNENVRKGWTLGDTIDANQNIIPFLSNLIA
jgi:phosphoglycolate phosphatase-like HAD superfamily hydrolase